MTLQYRVKTASKEEIYSHLMECDRNFVPPLSSRVDLLDYSIKIFEKSVSFEAWDEQVLVGMINAYLDNVSNRTGYITNVSILPVYMGQGIALTLLEMCLRYAEKHTFSRIRLEVSWENGPAIELYSKVGFKIINESGDNLLMEYEIPGKSVE